MKPRKPYNLKCWIVNTPSGSAHFFTCGRPRRQEDPEGLVSNELVHRWVLGLPRPNTAIVSLLGRKERRQGKSEFSYYSFCSEFDKPSEHDGRPTFQEWLNCHHKDLDVLVREHPTFDYVGTIPHSTLDAVKTDIEKLISMGRRVIVVDSGGVERTWLVCCYMGAKEDSCSNP